MQEKGAGREYACRMHLIFFRYWGDALRLFRVRHPTREMPPPLARETFSRIRTLRRKVYSSIPAVGGQCRCTPQSSRSLVRDKVGGATAGDAPCAAGGAMETTSRGSRAVQLAPPPPQRSAWVRRYHVGAMRGTPSRTLLCARGGGRRGAEGGDRRCVALGLSAR